MNKKHIVRLYKSELSNFKNIRYGEIKYINYTNVESHGCLEPHDVFGIYGQNGSGKTALVDVLDVLQYVLSGREIPYEEFSGMLSVDVPAKLVTYFYIERSGQKYKVKYELELMCNEEERRIELGLECLTYWRRGAVWKKGRSLEIRNPFYRMEALFDGCEALLRMEPEKCLCDVSCLKAIQNLAVFCAQKNVSLFFHDVMERQMMQVRADDSEEAVFADVVKALCRFGRDSLHVVKQRRNVETEEGLISVLFAAGYLRISEAEFQWLQSVTDTVNTAVKALVPNLAVELLVVKEEPDKEGHKRIHLNAFSVRGESRVWMKYEADGVRRMLSLLYDLVSVYNDPGVCLVVDELDSGVFEPLFGELVDALYGGAKGQLIFTANNLRGMEKLETRNIVCTTANPANRYTRLFGVEKTHNRRDFYMRALRTGGQKEALYCETESGSIGEAFEMAYEEIEAQ